MRTALVIVLCSLLGGHLTAQNFTNRGKEFWVGYGHNQFFNPNVNGNGGAYNTQEMVLYLSAEQEAHVMISVPGTSWSKSYTVPANTAITTVPMPKGTTADNGADARLLDEGLFKKNIFIKSDVPVAVFAHTYGSYSSGATMLLPVEAYGYTYYSSNTAQSYGDKDCYSWFYIVASEDNTTIRFTPTYATKGGVLRNTPFTVNLNKGEIYNVLGALQGGSNGFDMSGSKIQSIVGTDGNCHPIGVFSGSSRTGICQLGFDDHSGGDFMMQQCFPVSAWGTGYLTAVTTSTNGFTAPNTNKYRVFVKDLTIDVYQNGIKLSGRINNYYDFDSRTADYITASGPIMVAQILPSGLGCGFTGEGDPEMIYLSPVEQAINKVTFYSADQQAILNNYLTLIIPDKGLTSLKIDGVAAFDYTYAHPNKPGYTVVVTALPLTPMQHAVQSDSSFTGITYGLGRAESYGYNIGAYVNNLTVIPEIKPDNNNATYNYVCTKTPFHLSIKTIYQAGAITLHFSKTTDITPATDVTISNPVPSGTAIINGKTYYTYDLPDQYEFSRGGDHLVPVSITATVIDNCSQSEVINITIPVHQGPSVDFTALAGCASEAVIFKYIPVSIDSRLLKWDFGDLTTSTETNLEKKYAKGGTYNVKLQVIRYYDGCLGDTVKSVIVKTLPVVSFQLPTEICMPKGEAAFVNKTTVPGNSSTLITYQWQFGDGKGATSVNPINIYTAAAMYTVKLKAEFDGCEDSAALILPASSFVTTPQANFTLSAPSFCVNKTAGFLDQSSYDHTLKASWQWQLGNESASSDKDPVTIYRTARNYDVRLIVTAGGCVSDQASKSVSVYALPQVEAGADVIIAAGENTTLHGAVNDPAATLAWSPAMYLSATNITDPVATATTDQLFYLTATGTTGCSNYDSVLVKVYNDIKIPNIFTPNGDGINDLWEIKGLQNYRNATIDVYNRWGQLVVHMASGYAQPWNGTAAGGAVLPSGTYYYVLEPRANGYTKITGSITIIR